MSQREVAITGGPYGTKAMVTGQEELLVKVNNTAISVNGGGTGLSTPTVSRVTSSVSITNARKISISNVGAANGVVLGTTIKPTETITFEAILGEKLDAVGINGTGTDLLVSYVS